MLPITSKQALYERATGSTLDSVQAVNTNEFGLLLRGTVGRATWPRADRIS